MTIYRHGANTPMDFGKILKKFKNLEMKKKKKKKEFFFSFFLLVLLCISVLFEATVIHMDASYLYFSFGPSMCFAISANWCDQMPI